ncbi:hypothetical protein Metme_2831 [Methylomonas methanica MC09]|uniref:Outer membrane protein assembly factor BamC n=2 Tax=Methylomonas methanica TaxID=421 RepID=G0A073_METMM|nr:hypothetical protein Metme_2831 [Methylomonas methanica MC09]
MLCGLSACSTIKSWFPDKERDYQFTSEIPELIVPDDLKNKGLPSLTSQATAPVATETEAAVSDPSPAEADTESAQASEAKAEPQQAEVPETSATGGVSSLQIDQAKTPATRMVGRALTRQKVEIVERNVDKGYFYVKYDPNAVEAKDDSIWDEINFLFGEDPSQEQEYRISVRGIGPQMSEVTVQDEQGKFLSTPAANALLKLITEGINQVVDQDNVADEPEQPASEPVRRPITENPIIHD